MQSHRTEVNINLFAIAISAAVGYGVYSLGWPAWAAIVCGLVAGQIAAAWRPL